MAWGRIDDTFYDHPKVDHLGKDRLRCVGLYFLALSWSNRYLTDGFIPFDRVVRLGGTKFLAERLVRVGLWDLQADGYLVHDFLEYNDSGDSVRKRRVDMRELGKRGGIASGVARRLNPRTRPVFNPPTPLKKSDA
jgi:hypothetical protein